MATDSAGCRLQTESLIDGALGRFVGHSESGHRERYIRPRPEGSRNQRRGRPVFSDRHFAVTHDLSGRDAQCPDCPSHDRNG
jgi:hypothetical protein